MMNQRQATARPGAAMRATSRTVVDDRRCSGCGYELKGLDAAGLCPECGLPVADSAARTPLFGAARIVDGKSLGQAPLWYLLMLAGALVCMLAGGWYIPIVARWSDPAALHASLQMTGMAALCLWFIGALLCTMPRPARGHEAESRAAREMWGARLIVAVSQAAWPGLGVMIAMSGRQFVPGPAVYALLLLGVAGLAALALVLANICEWGGDEPQSRWLRGSAFFLIVLPFLVLLLSLGRASGIPIFGMLIFLEVFGYAGIILAYLALLFGILRMLWMIFWAFMHARAAAAVQRRIEHRRGGPPPAADAPGPALLVPEPAHEPVVLPVHPSRNERTIVPRPGVQPYGLEEDSDEPRPGP